MYCVICQVLIEETVPLFVMIKMDAKEQKHFKF